MEEKTDREKDRCWRSLKRDPLADTVIEIVEKYCEVEVSWEFRYRRSSPPWIIGLMSADHVLSSFLLSCSFVIAFLAPSASASSFACLPVESRFSCFSDD